MPKQKRKQDWEMALDQMAMIQPAGKDETPTVRAGSQGAWDGAYYGTPGRAVKEGAYLGRYAASEGIGPTSRRGTRTRR